MKLSYVFTAILGIAASTTAYTMDKPSGDMRIILATRDNNYPLVKDLIAANVDINVKDTYGRTALYGAVIRGYGPIALALIAAGADVHAKGSQGSTLLIHACYNRDAQIACALINAGSDVNAQDRNKISPLMHAVYNGSTRIVLALIAAGADVNVPENGGGSLLLTSFMNYETAIMFALIDAGASINVQDDHGKTVLISAATRGLTDLTQKLIAAGAQLDVRDEHDATAFIWAVHNNHIRTAQALIAAGALFNEIDYPEYRLFSIQVKQLFACTHTPFTPATNVDYTKNHAYEVAQLHCLHKLINEQYLRLDFIDPQGNTLLHNALLIGNRVMVSLLLYLMIKHKQCDALAYANKTQKQTPIEMATTKGAAWLLYPFFATLR